MSSFPIKLPGDKALARFPEEGRPSARVGDGIGKPAGRVADLSRASVDAHGCPACPHMCVGPAMTGSPTVFINDRPALRLGDMGTHAACCGPNTWQAIAGSRSVFINDRPAHRQGDEAQHCGGIGRLITGSPNVLISD
ncbi:MAG: hypothetical protein R2748_20670 [Bryobacterales bacterium]